MLEDWYTSQELDNDLDDFCEAVCQLIGGHDFG